MQVGDIVRVNSSFMGEPSGILAYVYEKYDYNGLNGVSLITKNGVDLGGFNKEEEDNYLEFVQHSGLPYTFSNVIQLDRDYKNGYFAQAFGSEAKRKQIMQQARECTKGHGKSCFYAKSDSCECDCGGENHGGAYKA